jgi:hypothetical protein
MNVESVSAVLFYSPDPARLAHFYRANLGIPFERQAPRCCDPFSTWGTESASRPSAIRTETCSI